MGKKFADIESLGTDCHPKTGDTDKYFCGDRFHDKNVREKDKILSVSISFCFSFLIKVISVVIMTLILLRS